MSNEIKRFANLHFWLGFILLGMIYWDHVGLKATSWEYFYPYKIFYILAFWGLAYIIGKKKIPLLIALDISVIVSYSFSYLSVKYLHPTYFFCFYECFLIYSFLYTGPLWRYSLHTIFAVTLTMYTVFVMPEPEFVKAGYSFKNNLYATTLIMALIASVIYFFFNRQRELYFNRHQKFISIGQQAAFLLHEIKSPLNRFLLRHSTKDQRDAESIVSIFQSIEMLMNHKQEIIKQNFSWERIKHYLSQEFEETCLHYQIELKITGFEGTAHGHEATIQMALRNLIKNAIEAIVDDNKNGTIEIHQEQQTIVIKNNGRIIDKEKVSKIFSPFFTEKTSPENFGLGLSFVQTVAMAHKGSVDLNIKDNWNVFTFKIGNLS